MNYVDPRSLVGVDQILAILDYMKDNPQLAHSRFSRTKEGRNLLRRHWAACADLANNVSSDCTQKTPDQWRSYYNAYKSKLKKKVKDMKAELVATGGAPAKKRLTDLENRLYSILGPDLGEQLPRVCNTPVSLQRLETEHQSSSSTTEVVLQDDTSLTIGSDSSDVELYYPEEHTGHLAANPGGHIGQLAPNSVVHTDQRLEFVVQTEQQPEPVVHNIEKLDSVVHNTQQLKPVVHNVQKLDSVVLNVQQIEPLVHNVQQLEPVVQTVQQPERVVQFNQPPRHVVHIDQQPKPIFRTGQQPELMVHSGQIKKEHVEKSPRQLRCRSSFEEDSDPAIRNATEVLLNMERMKTDAKRDVTAALHRLAGAMEAIAERLGGPVSLQVTSPPRVRLVSEIYSKPTTSCAYNTIMVLGCSINILKPQLLHFFSGSQILVEARVDDFHGIMRKRTASITEKIRKNLQLRK